YAISEILNERISFGLVGSKINNPQIEYLDLLDDELVLITPSDFKIDNKNNCIDIGELAYQNSIIRREVSGIRNVILSPLSKHNLPASKSNVIAHVDPTDDLKRIVTICRA
ncbi:hypothetical protein KSU65_22610, partial [Enterobacter cloacae]